MKAAMGTARSFLVGTGVTAAVVGFVVVFGYMALAVLGLMTSAAESVLPDDSRGCQAAATDSARRSAPSAPALLDRPHGSRPFQAPHEPRRRMPERGACVTGIGDPRAAMEQRVGGTRRALQPVRSALILSGIAVAAFVVAAVLAVVGMVTIAALNHAVGAMDVLPYGDD